MRRKVFVYVVLETCKDIRSSIELRTIIDLFINMKQINGQSSQQSSFLLSSQPHYLPSRSNHKLQSQPPQTSNQPLFNYLFQTSPSHSPEEPTNNTSEDLPAELVNIGLKIKRNKRLSIQERVKTDLSEVEPDWSTMILSLRRQNHILKEKVLFFQKKMVILHSSQGQIQYLSKLSLLQQSQIQKLRRMLRQQQCQQLQHPPHLSSQSKYLLNDFQNLRQKELHSFEEGGSIKIVLNKRKENQLTTGSKVSNTKKKNQIVLKHISTCKEMIDNRTISDWDSELPRRDIKNRPQQGGLGRRKSSDVGKRGKENSNSGFGRKR